MALPSRLQAIVDLFAEAPRELRLEALLEYSRGLPPLPESLLANHEAMEQVVECQSPFFLATELTPDRHVRMWFDSPPQAPTTRGYSSLRLRGMSAILFRLKSQVRSALASAPAKADAAQEAP